MVIWFRINHATPTYATRPISSLYWYDKLYQRDEMMVFVISKCYWGFGLFS